MRYLMIKAAAEVTKGELKSELQKHEDRETPAQEAAESKEEQELEERAGLHEKKAFYAGFHKKAGVKDFLKKLLTVHHDVSASKALPMTHTHGVDEKLLHKLSPKELLMAGAALGGGVGFGHEFGKRIGKGRQRKEHGPRVTPMPGGVVIHE